MSVSSNRSAVDWKALYYRFHLHRAQAERSRLLQTPVADSHGTQFRMVRDIAMFCNRDTGNLPLCGFHFHNLGVLQLSDVYDFQHKQVTPLKCLKYAYNRMRCVLYVRLHQEEGNRLTLQETNLSPLQMGLRDCLRENVWQGKRRTDVRRTS
jgi:hypothetical protein